MSQFQPHQLLRTYRRGELLKPNLFAALALLLVSTQATFAIAQIPVAVDFGVRAGMPFTVPLKSNPTFGAEVVNSAFERSPFAAGPAVGVVVYERVLVEFDALY